MKKSRLTKVQWLFVVIVLAVSLLGAWRINTEGYPNGAPDESGRQLLTNYIYQNNRLPIGREPEILLGSYGFSYALRPYLTAIIGAVFMKITAIFSTSDHAMIFASRLCSVLSVTLCAFFCFKLGNRLFKKKGSSTLFGILICFIPQVIFLGMYQNNDVFSLMTVVMALYYLVSGQQDCWPVKKCIGFAVSISLGLLSYYSVYGWLLMIGVGFLFSLWQMEKLSARQKTMKFGLIAGLVLCLAGWFFIRNAILNHGDFFGVATEDRWRSELVAQGMDVFQYNTPSISKPFINMLIDSDYAWLRFTTRSFIGYFGYMAIPLSQGMYSMFYLLYGMGILLYVSVSFRLRKPKEDRALFWLMLLSGLITLGLSMYQSYTRDYQPQGRYIITLGILFAYMMAYGLDKINISADGDANCLRWNRRIRADVVVIGIWLILFTRAITEFMSKMFFGWN